MTTWSKEEGEGQKLLANSWEYKNFSCLINDDHYEEEVVEDLLDCEMNDECVTQYFLF